MIKQLNKDFSSNSVEYFYRSIFQGWKFFDLPKSSKSRNNDHFNQISLEIVIFTHWSSN